MILMPVAVDVPMQRYPVANWVIMAVNILASVPLFFRDQSPWEIAGYAKSDPIIGTQLFTAMFTHGDFWHLLGNMIFLWVFGNAVNAKLGHALYIGGYLVCGIVAGVAWHLMGSGMVSVGASGAIMGVVGAFVVFFPGNSVSVFYWMLVWAGTFAVPAIVVVSIYVLLDLAGMMNEASGTANLAHLGGFAAGFAATLGAVLTGRFEPARYEKNLPQVMGLHEYDPRPMPIGFRD